MKSIAWDPDAPAPAPPAGRAAPHTLKEFGLDPAEHRLTLGAGSTVAEILLGKATPQGDVYAKDASRSIVFTHREGAGRRRGPQPRRLPVQGRLRASAPSPARASRSPAPARRSRSSARRAPGRTPSRSGWRWRRRRPSTRRRSRTSSARSSTLRAESFVDALPAGAAEFARIQTAFDEGKKHESVVIHQAGPDYYAVRQGDAGAAKLIAPAVTEARRGARRHPEVAALTRESRRESLRRLSRRDPETAKAVR